MSGKKKSVSKKSSEKISNSNSSAAGENLKREIFKNVENQFQNRLEAKGRVMEIIIQEKNKRIEELERGCIEREQEVRAAEGTVKALTFEKDKLAESYD